MSCQVLRNLFFGFFDEPERPLVTEHATCGSDRERASVPKGAQEAGFGSQFAESLFAPSEVIEFLEWATAENLNLRGETWEKPLSWFKKIGGGNLGTSNQGNPGNPEEEEPGRKELCYHLEMGLVHQATMSFLPHRMRSQPHLRLLLQKGQSEMALRDFLMRSPEGRPLREALERGPREFVECLKMNGPVRTPMTLFQQIRKSVETRMKNAYEKKGGSLDPTDEKKS